MSGRRLIVLLSALSGALLLAAPALAGGKPGKGPAAQPPTDQIVIQLAPGKSLDTSALASTAGVDLKQLRRLARRLVRPQARRSATPSRTGTAITDRLAARGDVVSAEPDADDAAARESRTTRAGPSSGTCSTPSSGHYGDQPPRRVGRHAPDPAAITVGVIDTGYRPHADLAGPLRPRLRLHRRRARRKRRRRPRHRRLRPGRLDHERRERERLLQGLRHEQQLLARHARLGHDRRRREQQRSASRDQPWVSKIQPLRVLGKCGGYTSDIADAIRWAAGLPVSGVPANPTPDRVVNISLGGSGACDSTTRARSTPPSPRAPWSSSRRATATRTPRTSRPANCNNVITVAATGHTGSRAYYSNYGSSVEIAAPGGDAQLGKTILSTLNAGTTTPGADSYANYQGTSMATPHVVGVVVADAVARTRR